MSEFSSIEWTHHTFNPWWGCARVSRGCEHCYAEAFAKRFGVKWGVQGDRRVFGEKHWAEPIKWNARAEKSGLRERVFCASMADVFEDRDELSSWRKKLAVLIERTRSLEWLLLTKRPENMMRLARMDMDWGSDWPANVWAGTTVEDQRRAEERIPVLVNVPAKVRFLSCEPLLERVDLRLQQVDGSIHWVICGGESGPGARSMDPEWARNLRGQCVRAGVPFHFKQWGGVVKKARGRVLDGRTWDEVPMTRGVST